MSQIKINQLSISQVKIQAQKVIKGGIQFDFSDPNFGVNLLNEFNSLPSDILTITGPFFPF